MNTLIQNDFIDFMNNEDLFNCEVILYVSELGSIVYEGSGIYDKKPFPVQNENGQVTYQGHISFLTLPLIESCYSSLKGYYVEITDNIGLKKYYIANSNYNSNVNNIYCELKEVT